MNNNNNVRRLGCRTGLTLLICATLLTTSGCGLFSSKPAPPQSGTEQQGPVTLAQAEPEQVVSQKVTTKKIRLRVDHPRRYIVKKGDTLWDIASTFLKDPWFWPELWHRNPDIANPHLIYPGDIITMIYVDGKPRILVNDEAGTISTMPAKTARKSVKLSPKIRRDSLDANIATIPGDAIRQFITRPRVVTKEEYENAPYILGSDDNHLILGEANRIYIRGELDKERVRYSVYRKGAKLINPENDELMGYEVIHAGEARITTYGDPASGDLTKTNREVLVGDRLMPTDKGKIDHLYYPRIPDIAVQGQVISLFDSLFGVAKFQIAVINRGAREGLETGHLLASYTSGGSVRDRYTKRRSYFSSSEEVKLPDERSGLLMIFKTFDHVSYALVLESTRVIHREDVVSTPR